MQAKKKKVNQYRIVVFSENTFEEIRSFLYKPWYLGAAIGILIVLMIGLVIGFLYFPPVNALIIKSQGRVTTDELLELRNKVLDMEKETKAQDLYITNLRQLISGEVIIDTNQSQSLAIDLDSIKEVPRIDEDELLRNEIDLETQLNTIAIPVRSNQDDSRTIEQLYLIPPVNGIISMEFNPELNHRGIDINAPSNTPIKSILDGYVIFSGWTLETGNTLGIQHGENLISFYKHNATLLKKTGSFVKAGEAVAIIGNSGTLSSGPHLHFELWLNGKPIDPTRYINF